MVWKLLVDNKITLQLTIASFCDHVVKCQSTEHSHSMLSEVTLDYDWQGINVLSGLSPVELDDDSQVISVVFALNSLLDQSHVLKFLDTCTVIYQKQNHTVKTYNAT